MLWTIIVVILVILWLLGAFGRKNYSKLSQDRKLGSCLDRYCCHPDHIKTAWD